MNHKSFILFLTTTTAALTPITAADDQLALLKNNKITAGMIVLGGSGLLLDMPKVVQLLYNRGSSVSWREIIDRCTISKYTIPIALAGIVADQGYHYLTAPPSPEEIARQEYLRQCLDTEIKEKEAVKARERAEIAQAQRYQEMARKIERKKEDERKEKARRAEEEKQATLIRNTQFKRALTPNYGHQRDWNVILDLIEQGISIDTLNQRVENNNNGLTYPKSALEYAIDDARDDVVEKLVKIPGVELNERHPHLGRTPLKHAFHSRQNDMIVKHLIMAGADIKQLEDPYYSHPLKYAMNNELQHAGIALVEKYTAEELNNLDAILHDVFEKITQSNSEALGLALAQALLHKPGFNAMKKTGFWQRTPLHEIAERWSDAQVQRHQELVTKLIDVAPQAISEMDRHNDTALLAAISGQKNFLATLLLNKIPQEAFDDPANQNYGPNLFDKITLRNNETLATLLVGRFTQTVLNNQGGKLLKDAITMALPSTVQALIDRGVDINQEVSEKRVLEIALDGLYRWSSLDQRKAIVRMLLHHPTIDLSQKDHWGNFTVREWAYHTSLKDEVDTALHNKGLL